MMAKILDCTLRDGGYYNSWDFSVDLINDYLQAMSSISIEYVELGFRFFNTKGFKGACAYTKNDFIRQLKVPPGLKLGVMVNASDLVESPEGVLAATSSIFNAAADSPLSFVRVAAHMHHIKDVLPCFSWLKEQGYIVGANLMQIADRSLEEIEEVARLASECPIDVLYFADSMGSLDSVKTSEIISTLRRRWNGALGIHAHDNMGMALANTLHAMQEGVTWLDSTVMGMGRGPGNTKTEYLAIELASDLDNENFKLAPLLSVIEKHFKPLHKLYRWGNNPYYYLAGRYGIHPSFVQEMISDTRYNEEELLTVINYLRQEGGKNFSLQALETSRNFYSHEPKGSWNPASIINEKEVLIIGPGRGAEEHRAAIETYIRMANPIVIALNAHVTIAEELITVRASSHPIRLLTDCELLSSLPQPLITPVSMLPGVVRSLLKEKNVLDYGLSIQEGVFYCGENHCILPKPLVLAYTLAIAASGHATRILLAGFDGYSLDDPRRSEVDKLLEDYQKSNESPSLLSVTPTRYKMPVTSIYALI